MIKTVADVYKSSILLNTAIATVNKCINDIWDNTFQRKTAIELLPIRNIVHVLCNHDQSIGLNLVWDEDKHSLLNEVWLNYQYNVMFTTDEEDLVFEMLLRRVREAIPNKYTLEDTERALKSLRENNLHAICALIEMTDVIKFTPEITNELFLNNLKRVSKR